MPKLEITGKLEQIGDIVSITYGEGKIFPKREIILDCTVYDRYNGTPRENHVQFEFSGDKCSLLDSFKIGDLVTVSFVLQGFFYESKTEQKKKNITKIIGYDCQLYKKQTEKIEEKTEQPIEQPAITGEGGLPF